MKLYELTGQMKELEALADDPDMEIAVRDTLDAVQGEFNDKAMAITKIVLNTDSDCDAIDNEVKRLQAKKKSIQNRKTQLIDYLRENMESAEIKKIQCDLFTITLVQGREIAVIDDESALPDDFVRVETKVSPDKNAITAELKDGGTVVGAHLERAKSSIRIK
jgi:predicted transcriptional regulator